MGLEQSEIKLNDHIVKIEEVVPDYFQCQEVLVLERNELLAQVFGVFFGPFLRRGYANRAIFAQNFFLLL